MRELKFYLHRFFEIAVIVKAVEGVFDLIASALLLFAMSTSLTSVVGFFTRKELLEDPNDFIATHLVDYSNHILFSTELFVVIYLAIHGLIKIGLAIAMRTETRRAFHVAEAVLGILIVYQLYRFTHTHSIALLIFTVMDIAIVYLIHEESRRIAGRKEKGNLL